LDWIITDDPEVLEELTYLEPLGKSDHICISWQLCFTNNPATVELKYNYWKADYPAVREKLSSINWKLEFENKSVNDMWKYLISVIDTCVTVFHCISIKQGVSRVTNSNKYLWTAE